MAIAELVVAGLVRAQPSGPVDGVGADDVVPRLAAVAAGVHRERAADGPRHPGEELRTLESVRRREARDLRRRDAGLGEHEIGLEPDLAVRVVHQHDRAGIAAVADEEIRPQAHEAHRLLLRQHRQEHLQVGEVARDVSARRAAAGAPAHVLRHRLVLAQAPAELRDVELEWLGHFHRP